MSSPFELEPRDRRVAFVQAIDSVKNSALEIPVLRNQVISMGRGTHNDDKRVTPFVFKDLKISSTHCYIWSIQFDESTPCICYLKDVSTNHTYVNNKPINNGEYVILNHNDEIEIINGFKGVFKYDTTQLALLKSFDQLFQGKIGDWCIIPKILGSGSFGKVQVAYRKSDPTTKLYAVKIIQPSVNNEKSEIESTILKRINHPNIVHIYDSLFDSQSNGIRIFQDLAIGGDLFSYLSTNQDYLNPISESEAILAIYQITSALDYLHGKGVVHRDLKLDNILVMDVPIKTPKLVLADFGVAKQNLPLSTSQMKSKNALLSEMRGQLRLLSPSIGIAQSHLRASNNYWMSTVVGTAEYAAPEINLLDKKKNQKYNEKVDSWSLGVIMFILLTGQSPFYANGLKDTIEKVQKGIVNLNGIKWQGISDDAKNFVKNCLNRDYAKRWSINECLHSRLFTSGKRGELITMFLAKKGLT